MAITLGSWLLPQKGPPTAAVHSGEPLRQAASQTYQQHMLDTYSAVTSTGLPNFMAAHATLPSSFQFKEWDELVQTPEDARVVES